MSRRFILKLPDSSWSLRNDLGSLGTGRCGESQEGHPSFKRVRSHSLDQISRTTNNYNDIPKTKPCNNTTFLSSKFSMSTMSSTLFLTDLEPVKEPGMMPSRQNAEWEIESEQRHSAHVVVDARSGCDGLMEFFSRISSFFVKN